LDVQLLDDLRSLVMDVPVHHAQYSVALLCSNDALSAQFQAACHVHTLTPRSLVSSTWLTALPNMEYIMYTKWCTDSHPRNRRPTPISFNRSNTM
jgi:hypothetical protein